MARYAGGGKATVEGCRSIDVLEWHRRGYLPPLAVPGPGPRKPPQRQAASVFQRHGMALSLDVDGRLHMARIGAMSNSGSPSPWTACRFGGERPWFVCSVASNGVYCGRRVTKLYGAGRLFACRHCYRLAYASQQESAHQRGLGKSQKIRMRLGGSPNMLEAFPDKPKGMHWRTYERWRSVHDAAGGRSTVGLMRFVERLGRRTSRRA